MTDDHSMADARPADESEAAGAEGDSSRIAGVLDSARRRLVETGARNRLIHVNRQNRRANCLNIVGEKSAEVYKTLCAQGKKMRFLATGKDSPEDEDSGASLGERPEAGSKKTGSEDRRLSSELGPEGMQKRILKMARAAKTAEEEQGVNVLYLAMGFLAWFESESSKVKREAPLVLVPVDLVRNNRTSSYELAFRDDEISTNLPLQERLKEDFGIALPDISVSDEWNPASYFSAVAEAVSGHPRWKVERDAMQLGFFSFAKLLMLRDLDPGSWKEGSLLENGLLSRLLRDGFAPEEPLFGRDERLDGTLRPEDIIQVVDADASQTKVIEEVRKGKSLVVQGPPGTGKSQTITNIIAAAAHDRKTVLFVAEKMAALSVVHRRLLKAGLKDLCLELHSRKANKRMMSQALGRTLQAAQAAAPVSSDCRQLTEARDSLNGIADLLHSKVSGKDYTPFETISDLVGYIGAGAKPPSVEFSELENLDNAGKEEIKSQLERFAELIGRFGVRSEHPFRGTGSLGLQPTDQDRVRDDLAEAAEKLEALRAEAASVSKMLGSALPERLVDVGKACLLLDLIGEPPPNATRYIDKLYVAQDNPQVAKALDVALNWRNLSDVTSLHFKDSATIVNLSDMQYRLGRGATSFLYRLFPGYRRACAGLRNLLKGELPKDPGERLKLINSLAELRKARTLLTQHEILLRNVLRDVWSGEQTDFREICSAFTWLKQLRALGAFDTPEQVERALKRAVEPRARSEKIRRELEVAKTRIQFPLSRLELDLAEAGLADSIDSTPLKDLAKCLDRLLGNFGRYSEWVDMGRLAGFLNEHGLSELVSMVDSKEMSPSAAIEEFGYAISESRWKFISDSAPEVARVAGTDRHELVRRFCDLERRRIEDVKGLIRSRHLEQVPLGADGQMAFIRAEVARKRGHKPIRRVMDSAGKMVQRIKPVLLMSPISIAQFLPPHAVEFDLLVIDEASQIRPEDSFGSIVRAKQIVVVGDRNQLPPTSFFQRLSDNSEEDGELEADEPALATEMESVLTLCEARGLRGRMLEWHYRSRDPSLIRVSNDEFYENKLILTPSPLQNDEGFGLKFNRVPGVYSSASRGGGRAGTNRIEAEEVAKAVAVHARKSPEFSLGVVTFSKAQADMVNEILEFARREDKALDDFLVENKPEDFFVKNIENVQGDERDVIMISVGYGPSVANGRLESMSFGPVNNEGGERRLNVLFSRSRLRCEVFASFDPGDIDTRRTSREGPRVLKRFLKYAQTRELDEKIPGRQADGSLASHESPFERDVGDVIRSLGHDVDHQVGSGGFRVDLGVRNPKKAGQYILAVECDGASYHSALWARERDRLRQMILEGLGWRFHRIWSTDWFHRRDQEIGRLKEAIEAAARDRARGVTLEGANASGLDDEEEDPVEAEEPDSGPVELEPARSESKPYTKASFGVGTTLDPSEIRTRQLAEVVEKIVGIEGPVHVEEVARRVAALFGLKRSGSRVQRSVEKALDMIRRESDGLFESEDGFWLTSKQRASVPVRDRSQESGSLLRAESISPLEIREASRLITEESGRMEEDEMVKCVAKRLGFGRAGADLREAIRQALAGGS